MIHLLVQFGLVQSMGVLYHAVYPVEVVSEEIIVVNASFS